MSGFSPSLTLAGMDYIAPSMECIKPTQAQAVVGRHSSRDAPTAVDAASLAAVGRQEVMKITLADCLACSGCVTTAETVLVEAQSRRELCSALGLPPPPPHDDDDRKEEPKRAAANADAVLRQRRRPVLVTVSEQSAASLAAYSGCSLAEGFHRAAGFLRRVLTAEAPDRPVYISDLRWALDIAGELTSAEYQRRVADARCRGAEGGAVEGERRLPMLVSACPGWVCYCEKQGAALLPLLSPVLSPQGIAGSVAKRGVSADLYHISIQPCFDRKLEAARDGYVRPPGKENAEVTPYTDCVLSTAELLEWMLETDPVMPWRAALDSDLAPFPPAQGEAASKQAQLRLEGSGGYHRRAIEAIAGVTAASSPEQTTTAAPIDITYEVKRNRNHQIASSSAISGNGDKHCFCVAYGFQQIQNTVRGIKKNLPAARAYTFVELMACPDGCLNGGGQVRVATGDPQKHAAQLNKVEELFEEYLTSQEKDTGAEERVFSRASIARIRASLPPEAFHCNFRDRQKEFEEALNQGNIHSLKW